MEVKDVNNDALVDVIPLAESIENNEKEKENFQEETFTEEDGGEVIAHLNSSVENNEEDRASLLERLKVGYLHVINVGVFEETFYRTAVSHNTWAFADPKDRGRLAPGDFVLLIYGLTKTSDLQGQGYNRSKEMCYGRVKEISLLEVKSVSDDCNIFQPRESKKKKNIEMLRYSFDYNLILRYNTLPYTLFSFENFGKEILEARRRSDISHGAAFTARIDEEYLDRFYNSKVPFYDPSKPLKLDQVVVKQPPMPVKRKRHSKKFEDINDKEITQYTRMTKVHYHHPAQIKECIRIPTHEIKSISQLLDIIRSSFKTIPGQEIKLHYIDPEGDLVIIEDRTTQEELLRFAESIHATPTIS
eukprot:TRINITY_DN7824_c0_g1_i4.p1 TRINITY_DN7824_c0_g1~~TRINITY_DN7824_c0_g1_i4.p1  ORF type:complete len:359 (+),score=109.91 TRINITY_DN7824_c0_g1_i4:79-1155(+)